MNSMEMKTVTMRALLTACAALACAAGLARAADAGGEKEEKPAAPTAALAVYDAGGAVKLADGASSLGESAWKPAAAGAAFGGDAVLVGAGMAAVIRKDGSGVDLYARGPGGWNRRGGLAPAAGNVQKKLSGLKAVQIEGSPLAGVEAGVEGGGGLLFSINKDSLPAVKVTPRGNVEALRFSVPCRLGVLSDFYADDMMVDSRKIPIDRAEIPSDHIFLHLAAGGDSIVAAVCEKVQRDLAVNFTGQGDARTFQSTDVFFHEGGSIHAAILEAPAIWYSRHFTADEIRKGGPLDWKVPFIAKWKANYTRADGTISSRQILYGRNWDDGKVDGLEGKDGILTAVMDGIDAKKDTRFPADFYVVPNGVMAAYPLGRDENTPLDRYCVDDLLRLLDTNVCAYLLDVDARGGMEKGIFTCAYNAFLPTIMPEECPRNDRAVAEFIKDERVFIRKYNEQVILFIGHIQDRINGYVKFRKELLALLDEQEKAHPNLADFTGRLRTQLQQKVQVFARRVDPLQEADGVQNATPLLAEREKALRVDLPTLAARAVEIGPGIKHIGDPQDTRVQRERMNAILIRTMASMEVAVNPEAAEIARKVREMTEQVLRGGAAHEKPVTW